jgi:hypothetical protein
MPSEDKAKPAPFVITSSKKKVKVACRVPGSDCQGFECIIERKIDMENELGWFCGHAVIYRCTTCGRTFEVKY